MARGWWLDLIMTDQELAFYLLITGWKTLRYVIWSGFSGFLHCNEKDSWLSRWLDAWHRSRLWIPETALASFPDAILTEWKRVSDSQLQFQVSWIESPIQISSDLLLEISIQCCSLELNHKNHSIASNIRPSGLALVHGAQSGSYFIQLA